METMLLSVRHLTLLVLSDPTDQQLGLLEELPDTADIIVGDRFDAFTSGAEEADIMLVRDVPADLARDVWQLTERLRWIHVQGPDSFVPDTSATVTRDPETGQALEEALRPFLDNFKRFQRGEPLLNVIKEPIG